MNAVAERRASKRECASCGARFIDRSRTSPRTYCYDCSPSKVARPTEATPTARKPLVGTPFTVEHFRGWAARLLLDSGELWRLDAFQEAFVQDLFEGFRECWLLVPEGNGKSTLVAALALYHIEHQEDGRVPVAASARDQAGIIYRQAEGLIRRNNLEQTFRCHSGYRRIVCDATRSTIQIHAADAGTADGEIFTLALVDELHRHDHLELYRTWNGKLDKREGAQLIVISTAGVPGGEFESERELLRQTASITRDGCFVRAASETSVLHEWAVPEDGDVEDFELVASANPLGTITPEMLAAKRKRIRHLGHWKRFTCNVPTRTDEAAVTEAEWFAATVDEMIPEGERVWLGLDLGWKYDTTAMVPLWIRDPEFRLFGPATILEPPRDGTMLDPAGVERALLAVHARNPVHTVVMDMTDGAQLSTWIERELGCTVIDRTQSSAFAALDYARFMEALRNGWLKHTGDPGLTRHVLNAVARMDKYGAVRFERPKPNRKSSYQDMRVIDALAAAAMAHTTAAAELGVEDAEPMVAYG